MGDKKVSIRTLPDGSKVYHHPDGKQFLIRESSPLRDKLNARVDLDRTRHAALKLAHRTKALAKSWRQRDRGVPPEKSVLGGYSARP